MFDPASQVRGGSVDALIVLATQTIKNDFLYQVRVLDHNDPSKPSHRLTNGLEPSKTIESDGSNIKKPS